MHYLLEIVVHPKFKAINIEIMSFRRS